MRYKDQATTVFSEIASIIESSDNAENNIYDIVDFIDECQNYWEDHFDDVVEEVEEYADCDFKKPLREPFEETN